MLQDIETDNYGCESAREDMDLYIHGELDENKKARFDRHLCGCGECRELYLEEKHIYELVMESAYEPERSVSAFVMEKIRSENLKIEKPKKFRFPFGIATAAVVVLVMFVANKASITGMFNSGAADEKSDVNIQETSLVSDNQKARFEIAGTGNTYGVPENETQTITDQSESMPKPDNMLKSVPAPAADMAISETEIVSIEPTEAGITEDAGAETSEDPIEETPGLMMVIPTEETAEQTKQDPLPETPVAAENEETDYNDGGGLSMFESIPQETVKKTVGNFMSVDINSIRKSANSDLIENNINKKPEIIFVFRETLADKKEDILKNISFDVLTETENETIIVDSRYKDTLRSNLAALEISKDDYVEDSTGENACIFLIIFK